jgi:hypothetical protein
VPVLVRQCSAEGLLKPIIYIDLIGLNDRTQLEYGYNGG